MKLMQRVSEEPAVVLHSYPWKETSLLVQLWTQHHGRIAVVARGACRPKSALRAVLLQFQYLLVSWQGKGEIPNLTHAEWQGDVPPLPRGQLLSSLYLNELILRFTPINDPCTPLFEAYIDTLQHLATKPTSAMVRLREFELVLIESLGLWYAPEWVMEMDLPRNTLCYFHPEYGVYAWSDALHALPLEQQAGLQVSYGALYDLIQKQFDSPETATTIKRIVRFILQWCLQQMTLDDEADASQRKHASHRLSHPLLRSRQLMGQLHRDRLGNR
jgi:DNA repair protein RecO (recombination protein O)